MPSINQLSEEFNSYLKEQIQVKEPYNLYDPIKYILDLGGKRIRPLLVLLAADLFGNDYKKALPAALAVEVFHNFTLIHDDIMDAAPLRRGKVTVHQKWNQNIAILSGDAMMIKAYQFIEAYPDEVYSTIMKIFNKTAIEVCEGQQFDMDFESLQNVTIEQYLEMIRLKTSVLLAAAFEIGAIIGNANEKDRRALYQFGLNLGIAFQIQDDYLDTFGNEKTFGKQIGGDILEHKKTFLYLHAIKNSTAEEILNLDSIYQEDINPKMKIKKVTQFFIDKKVPEIAQESIEKYTQNAFNYVDELSIDKAKKDILKDLGINLMNRTV